MTPTLESRVAKALELGEAATPGPWRLEVDLDGQCSSDRACTSVVSASGELICDDQDYYPSAVAPHNQALIAAAPSHCDLIAKLADRVRELEADAARLRDAAVTIRDDLLNRAKNYEQPDAQKVVACGNGAWIKLNDALRTGAQP